MLGGLGADVQAARDLPVRESFAEQAQDLLLALRQELDRTGAGAALGPERPDQCGSSRGLAVGAELLELAVGASRYVDCESTLS